MGSILGAIFGGVVALAGSYGLYRLVDMIISGVASESWVMAIAGGILLYFFGGLLIAVVVVGALIVFISIVGD